MSLLPLGSVGPAFLSFSLHSHTSSPQCEVSFHHVEKKLKKKKIAIPWALTCLEIAKLRSFLSFPTVEVSRRFCNLSQK